MKKQWDIWGIALSTACVIQSCSGSSSIAIPAVEIFVHNGWFHRIFATLVVITTPLAFIPGYRRHKLQRVLGCAVAGLVLVILGALLDGQLNEVFTHGISISGSLLLVSAHVLNIRYSRQFHPVKHTHSHTEKCC